MVASVIYMEQLVVAPIHQLVLDISQVETDIAELKTFVEFAHDLVKILEVKSSVMDHRISETVNAVERLTSLQNEVSKLQRDIKTYR
jgi:hypothetical protein